MFNKPTITAAITVKKRKEKETTAINSDQNAPQPVNRYTRRFTYQTSINSSSVLFSVGIGGGFFDSNQSKSSQADGKNSDSSRSFTEMRSYFVPVIAVAIIVPASLSARTGALDGDASIIPARDHKCPLSGVKRTSVLVMRISVPDPKQTLSTTRSTRAA